MIRILLTTTAILLLRFPANASKDSLEYIQPVVNIKNQIPSNSGDIFWTNFTTVISSILGVLLGFVLSSFKERLSRRREMKSNGRGWTETFVQLIEPIEKQIIELDTFLKRNDLDSPNLTMFKFYEQLEGKDFDNYDARLVSSFLSLKMDRKEAIILTGKLTATVRVIKSRHASMVQAVETFKQASEPNIETFGKAFHEFKK